MRIAFYLLAILFLLMHPMDTAQAARNALLIWGNSVVPALFPYMILCRTLFKYLNKLHLPLECAATVLGMVGGSPSGAAVLTTLGGRIPPRKLHSLCALTGTISPMFLLGTVQTWTKDVMLCRKLLLCHWAGAILCSVIVYAFSKDKTESLDDTQTADSSIVFEPLTQSIDAILQVGGCIILYSVFAEIICKALAPLPSFHPMIHAALEISGGIHAICKSNIRQDIKGILFAAAFGFSSFSILAQNQAMLSQRGIRLSKLVCFALIRMVLSSGLMALIY